MRGGIEQLMLEHRAGVGGELDVALGDEKGELLGLGVRGVRGRGSVSVGLLEVDADLSVGGALHGTEGERRTERRDVEAGKGEESA